MRLPQIARVFSFFSVLFLLTFAGHAKKKAPPAPVPLTEQGKKLQGQYGKALKALQETVKKALPAIDQPAKATFMKAHKAEWGEYNKYKQEQASLKQAKPLLMKLDGLLSDGKLDQTLVKGAVLRQATPRGLAVFAQQGATQRKLIDELLNDHQLMKDMLYAGGAKAGRYGKAMAIYDSLQKASKHLGKPSSESDAALLRRLAIAVSLELAAPELCHYEMIDPVARYLAYEKWYLNGELDPMFKNLSTWQYRHVINDPRAESDLVWLRTMLRNYRPDAIETDHVRLKYVAIFLELPHKGPEWDEDITRIQATMCSGGRCGPKASFGRALTRSFGIPTWGARVKRHTAMTYLTPKGWTTSLSIGWSSSFWIVDQPDQMRSVVFRMDAQARDLPKEYIKAMRAQWIGDCYWEKKADGMTSGTGGFWHALALNQKRLAAFKARPNHGGKHTPWVDDTFHGKPQIFSLPSFPLVEPDIPASEKQIAVDSDGTITIPAVACSAPLKSTKKILFMASAEKGYQLHYKRKEMPETFSYDIKVAKAGDYFLSANAVTVNRGQSFMLTVNEASPVQFAMPYTPGQWDDAEPIKISLKQGKNKLSFTRPVPEDYKKIEWQRSGPGYGGISLKSLTLKPIN